MKNLTQLSKNDSNIRLYFLEHCMKYNVLIEDQRELISLIDILLDRSNNNTTIPLHHQPPFMIQPPMHIYNNSMQPQPQQNHVEEIKQLEPQPLINNIQINNKVEKPEVLLNVNVESNDLESSSIEDSTKDKETLESFFLKALSKIKQRDTSILKELLPLLYPYFYKVPKNKVEFYLKIYLFFKMTMLTSVKSIQNWEKKKTFSSLELIIFLMSNYVRTSTSNELLGAYASKVSSFILNNEENLKRILKKYYFICDHLAKHTPLNPLDEVKDELSKHIRTFSFTPEEDKKYIVDLSNKKGAMHALDLFLKNLLITYTNVFDKMFLKLELKEFDESSYNLSLQNYDYDAIWKQDVSLITYLLTERLKVEQKKVKKETQVDPKDVNIVLTTK